MDKNGLITEIKLKAIRSSGAGGQHVNKVSSKVELTFNVLHSTALSDIEKKRITTKLAHRLTKEYNLILQVDDHRSQHRNKDLVIKRFLELMEGALKVQKRRKKSKPTKSSIEKRLKSKKKSALKKVNRRKPDLD